MKKNRSFAARDTAAHAGPMPAAASLLRRLCVAGLATASLPSCILLNATSHWHAEQISPANVATVTDKPGFGLIAATTDWPIYLEDFDPAARRTSQWCWSHRAASVDPPGFDPTGNLHQGLGMVRVPAGDYAVSRTRLDMNRNANADAIRWIRVADGSRLFLGDFALRDHRTIAAPKGFSPSSDMGPVSAAEARPPLCAVF